MDPSRFDAWTRRRLGLLTGGLAASLLAAIPLPDADAKKKKKKKRRCRKARQPCGGKKKKCCKSLTCETVGPLSGTRCCRTSGQSCPSSDDDECCGDLSCDLTSDPLNFPGMRCCAEATSACDATHPCCSGLICVGGICLL